MHGGEIVSSPDEVRRTVDEDEIESVRSALRAIVPELAEAAVSESSICLFTNTPDHDFVVDFHNNLNNDDFYWAPTVKTLDKSAGGTPQQWEAAKEFGGNTCAPCHKQYREGDAQTGFRFAPGVL